jgi:hypothetical protein
LSLDRRYRGRFDSFKFDFEIAYSAGVIGSQLAKLIATQLQGLHRGCRLIALSAVKRHLLGKCHYIIFEAFSLAVTQKAPPCHYAHA